MNMKLKLHKLKLIISIWLGAIISLAAQSSFDIRLQFENYDTVNQIANYTIQLRSADNRQWGLAGQNYRLYYDASKATFQQGISLLPAAYQDFNLVQHIVEIDASHIQTQAIDFSKTLSFLNFAIDLNNTTDGGIFLPQDGTWVSTTRLSFKGKSIENIKKLEVVWGRDQKTNDYATSFVEIHEWVASNTTSATFGTNFFDIVRNKLKIKLFLQGPYNSETNLMDDNLRRKGYLPLEEPYSKIGSEQNLLKFKQNGRGGEKVATSVFDDRGEKSIVDWIFLELRNKNKPSKIEVTQVALLQKNGAVVALNGYDPVQFSSMPDSFYLAIKHRNHLGIMSKELLSKSVTRIDFSAPQTNVWGNHARLEENGVMLLWGGNADSDNYLVLNGGGIANPDKDYVFFDILLDKNNKNKLLNHIAQGYYCGDTNMDGEVRYQGMDNDISMMIFVNIIRYPDNDQYYTNYVIEAQLSK